MLSRIILSIAFVVLSASATEAIASDSLVGRWRWREKHPDSVVRNDLTLKANGDFVWETSYRSGGSGPTHSGWWRIERGSLALNFWNGDASEHKPYDRDFTFKIVGTGKDTLRLARDSNVIILQRV